jgi:hypothetical protein
MNFRKYVLPSVLILGLAASFAIAQNINKALQLSQDNTGAFGVDTNNGVYFPGHILSTGTGRPSPTIAGTGTPTIAGTDTAGLVTSGSAATTATVTFGQAFVTAPECVVSSQTAATPVGYTTSTTQLAMTFSSATGLKVNYWCPSLN